MSCRCAVSVSPLLCHLFTDRAAQAPKATVVDHDLVEDLKKVAVLGEPIVGVESVTLDEHGQGGLAPRILPSPREPTQAEIDRHNVLHFPFASWCPVCVSCRRPNDHHRLQLDRSRELPLLVGDYCFIRNTGDDALVCVLVMKLYPYGILFASVVPNKGFNEDVIAKVSQFVVDTGLTHFATAPTGSQASCHLWTPSASRLGGKVPA